MMWRLCVGVLLFVVGCDPSKPDVVPEVVDEDGDGVAAPGDCDDGDADVGAERAWWLDEDADGWGGVGEVTACEAPAGYVSDGGDCDDTDPAVHPAAPERCNDMPGE